MLYTKCRFYILYKIFYDFYTMHILLIFNLNVIAFNYTNLN